MSEDDGWCEETNMSYAMMDVIDDALRMFLPWPFHEPKEAPMTTQPTNPHPTATEAAARKVIAALFRQALCAMVNKPPEFNLDEYAAIITEDLIANLAAAHLTITAAPPSGQVCVDRALVADAADYIVPRGVQGHRIRNGLRAALTEGATV